MNCVETAVCFDGPDSFWAPVKYLQTEPLVGLVVVRHLLNDEEVRETREAAGGTMPSLDDRIREPDRPAVRRILHKNFAKHGIVMDSFDAVNCAYAGKSEVWHGNDFGVTDFGLSHTQHADNCLDNDYVGVTFSLSIGECDEFGACLPGQENELMYTANLHAGDAAFWLQPGEHKAITTDPNRFGCLYATLVPQRSYVKAMQPL